MNDKTINQPTTAEQKTLDDVLENSIDYITIRGKKVRYKMAAPWNNTKINPCLTFLQKRG